MTNVTPDRADRSPDQRRSHPAAQALLAGLMQGIGEKHGDQAMVDAGERLAAMALKASGVAEKGEKPKGRK